MSKRLNKQYKKHCAFVWVINEFNISNEFIYRYCLTDDELIETYEEEARKVQAESASPLCSDESADFDDLVEQIALKHIQAVREQRETLPDGWLAALKETLSQQLELAIKRGEGFDNSGHPTWNVLKPESGDRLNAVFVLISLIAVERDRPAFLLEKCTIEDSADL